MAACSQCGKDGAGKDGLCDDCGSLSDLKASGRKVGQAKVRPKANGQKPGSGRGGGGRS